jgi:hypothetical protein
MRAWLVAACVRAGCGASTAQVNGQDASTGADSGMTDVGAPFTPIQPELIFIDGVSQGNAVDAKAAPFTIDDVRVCIFDSNNAVPLFTYALPDNVFLPSTNIAGIHRGGATDLGTLNSGTATVTLDIFSANDLQSDTAVSQDRTAYTCKAMTCTVGATCRPHVVIPNVTISAGKVNVIAVVDDANATSVIAKQSAFDDAAYAGTPNSIYGALVDHSGYGGTDDVNVYFGTSDGSEPNIPLSTPITRDQAHPPTKVADDDTGVLDSLGLRADAISGQQPASRFWQSLDSIAFVSDESVDPKTFYDVRKNFVIALVGDPKDSTSVAKNGGRDPAFDGRGLHFVAVAYAPTPQ